MGLMSKWTDGERKGPEPLEGNVVATTVTGTLLWFLLFLGQLPFYGRYAEHGHDWWIWTCAAGTGLGLLGIWYVRHREKAARAPEAPSGGGSRDGAGSTDAGADRTAGTAAEPPASAE